MKKIASMLLVLAMLFSFAMAEVNTEGYEPIWLGDDAPVITVACGNAQWDENSDPGEMYFFKYAEEFLNVKFEPEYYSGERLNMMYASDTLPDLLLGRGGSTGDTIMYGATTHQYMDLTPYLTEELAPTSSLSLRSIPMRRAPAPASTVPFTPCPSSSCAMRTI